MFIFYGGNMVSEKKKISNKKWNDAHMKTIGCRLTKIKADELRNYAELQGLTISKFASLAMQYCKDNNINLQLDNDKVEL